MFIEYAPLETAWVPVVGENYLYIYCLWVLGAPRGSGYGRALMEHGIPAAFELVDSLEKAKSLPCVFNNWAAFWNGSFISVNQLDGAALEKVIRRAPQP